MTQIVVCLDPNVVAMVADRRLTNLATGELVEDEACKMVVQGRQVPWAYTGLANVKPAPRGEAHFQQKNRAEHRPGPIHADTTYCPVTLPTLIAVRTRS